MLHDINKEKKYVAFVVPCRQKALYTKNCSILTVCNVHSFFFRCP
jgi:hypothetical protein